MSGRTGVFIYGSCVARDTVEHMDPDQFELVDYVARQSAISAYTKPVTAVDPPVLESAFQQRMLSGDWAASLRSAVPDAADRTDLVLIDLTDERLGVYVLPDGSVITRTPELIESGAEQLLPAGTRLLTFGSDDHFLHWSTAMTAVAQHLRTHMPRAAIALLDIPWASRSEGGGPTPGSFGATAEEANRAFRPYVDHATSELDALVIAPSTSEITSSGEHPWGDAPFHYSEEVYIDVVRRLTGSDGRRVWHHHKVPAAGRRKALVGGPNFLVAGTQHAGAEWLTKLLGTHPDVFMARGKGTGYFNRPQRVNSQEETELYLKAFADGQQHRWRGECTPDYFWHSQGSAFGPKRPDTALRIHELVDGDTPVFVILRSPVERAVYAYWRQFALGNIDVTNGIFRAPKQYGIIDRGFYARHLTHWRGVLGSERLHILFHDDILHQPRAVLTEAFHTLGIEPTGSFWDTADMTPSPELRSWMRPFLRKNPVDAQEVCALIEVYRADIAAVETATGRDLERWTDQDDLVRRMTSLDA